MPAHPWLPPRPHSDPGLSGLLPDPQLAPRFRPLWTRTRTSLHTRLPPPGIWLLHPTPCSPHPTPWIPTTSGWPPCPLPLPASPTPGSPYPLVSLPPLRPPAGALTPQTPGPSSPYTPAWLPPRPRPASLGSCPSPLVCPLPCRLLSSSSRPSSLPGAFPACLSSCSNCFQIRVGGQGPGVLLHAKFINRAVFPDGRWLQPGEQVDWDQNNNRWRADNEFLDTYLLP